MADKKLRMSLESILIYYDGDEFVDEGEEGRQPSTDVKGMDNVVEATLEYPRSGAALVSTTKQMDLPSRKKVELDTDNFWEAGLFKEVVDSETKFRLAISDKDKRSRFSIWLRNILSVVLNTSVDPKVKAITNVFAGAVAGDLQTRLVKGVKGNQDESSVMALCASKDVYIELSGDSLSAFIIKEDDTHENVLSDTGIMKLELFASQNFEINIGREEPRTGTRIRRTIKETVFKKGEKLGEVTIRVKLS